MQLLNAVKTVWHGLFLGRLRKPHHSVRLFRPIARPPKWAPGGPALRLHIGLENVDDLKADLERGFAAFKRRVARAPKRGGVRCHQPTMRGALLAYEHFMGRWSRQLSSRFVEFTGDLRWRANSSMLDAEPEASPVFMLESADVKKHRRRGPCGRLSGIRKRDRLSGSTCLVHMSSRAFNRSPMTAVH